MTDSVIALQHQIGLQGQGQGQVLVGIDGDNFFAVAANDSCFWQGPSR